MTPQALADFVGEMLKALGVSVQNVQVSGESRLVVAVESPESKLLIGPHGEHLQALNVLARRLVEAKRGEQAATFLIDVNGYHELRLKTLRDNALLLAQRARLFKHDVELSPMSAYERLVIHELFAADPEIATESDGEGKLRHIVLKYKTRNTNYDEIAAATDRIS